jgi:hypothetical protein
MAEDALFRTYPLAGTRRTSCGDLPVPYHVYDGQAVLVGGWVDQQAVRCMLENQDAQPVLSSDGRALAGIWICDFIRASLGKHSELQVALAVTRSALPPVKPNPFALLRLIALEPELRLFCHGLWNDSPAVVAYNREVLGLDARLCRSSLDRSEDSAYLSCRFETEDGGLILQGDLEFLTRQPFIESLALVNGLGRPAMQRVNEAPWLGAQVMSPAGPVSPHNAEAQTYLRAGATTAVRFKHGASRLEFGETPYRALEFEPSFVECFSAFQFVYLNPYNQGDERYGNPAA